MFSPLQYFLLFNRHDGYGFDRAGVLACAAADTFICVNQRKTAIFFAYCSPGAFHDTEAAFDAGVFIDDGQADLCFLLFSQSQPAPAGKTVFFTLAATALPKSMPLFSARTKIAATAPPVSNFRRVGLNGAAGIGAIP